MRNDRVINLVAGLLILGSSLVQPRDRIAHPMA